MITDERMSAMDGLRALGFEETGAYVPYRVFSLPGIRGVACVAKNGTILTGLKASRAADSSGSSFALHVARASKLDVVRASKLPDPDVAVQAFKDDVIEHSTFMSRLVTVPEGFAYGFSSGFGLATVLLLLSVAEHGYSAVPFVVIVAILAGLVGGQYRVRRTARESVYRRDENRKYERIKRIETKVASLKPVGVERVEGRISGFVEEAFRGTDELQSKLNEIHSELKALNESTVPFPEFSEISRFNSFGEMESALDWIEIGFDEIRKILELEQDDILKRFRAEIWDLQMQLREVEAALVEITPGAWWVDGG